MQAGCKGLSGRRTRMKSGWLTRIACIAVLSCLLLALGCTAPTPERQRRRAYVTKTDLEHMMDDVEWLLGYEHPVRSFDREMP